MAAEISIPGELVNHIVSYLLDDKASLRSCSLVAQQWRSFAQPPIFRSITIEEKTTTKEKNDTKVVQSRKGRKVKGKKDRPIAPAKFDIVKLVSVLTTAGQYVRDLEIICGSLDASEMAKVLDTFTDLERLTVKANLVEVSSRDLPTPRSQPTSLKELHLRGFTFEMNDWMPKSSSHSKDRRNSPAKCALVQFLSLFGEVDTITTEDVYPVGGTGAPNGDGAGYSVCRCCHPVYPEDSGQRSAVRAEGIKLSHRFSVRRLVTAGTNYCKDQQGQEVVLDLLLASQKSLRAVRELEIDEHPVITRELLEATGPQLERLRLSVTFPALQVAHRKNVSQDLYGTSFCGPDLAYAHICLHHNFAMPDNIDDYWRGYIVAFQDTIKALPPTVPHLVVEFNCGKLMSDHFDWHSFDGMLVGRDLVQLELVFKIRTYELTKVEHKQFIISTRRSVPQLARKLGGNLKIHVMDRDW
ncbi:hypothetical protein BXZ70DRAFT_927640 [Cristinia sonorae]|uniref:F-box domain-containing protein n=1 Tax=Cristinia sonorae TaxID=1940300 RepID=A0A8K0US16_9AGAR|nr:hypothetical protein BXZ70DRAFT_927640 [Cristinia sonorae]